jgi:CheY-like chemotaxis protein
MVKEPKMAPILVVDDDRAIRETLHLLLEDAGYEVAEAEDGIGALRMLRANSRPMVVLLDLMMPRMSGYQVLAAVAGDPGLLQTHAYIVLTACPQARRYTLRHLGTQMNVPCVEKPFDLDDLLNEIERAVARVNRVVIASALEAAEAADVVEACR